MNRYENFKLLLTLATQFAYELLQIKSNEHEIFEQQCATSVKTNVQFVNLL